MRLIIVIFILCMSFAHGWSNYTFQGLCVSNITQANNAFCVRIGVNASTFNIIIGKSFSEFATGSTLGDPVIFILPDPNFISQMDPTCTNLRSIVPYQAAVAAPLAKNAFYMVCLFPRGLSQIQIMNTITLKKAKKVDGIDNRFILLDEWWSIFLANWFVS